MHHCPNCGELLNDNMAFCPSCGIATNVTSAENITCPRCGEHLQDDERYCHRCGLNLTGEYTESSHPNPQPKQRSFADNFANATFWFVVIVACIIVGFKFYYASRGYNDIGVEDEYVTTIINSYPVLYPDTTYGKALTKFFSDRSWKHYVDDERDIVEFNGTCLYENKETRCTLIFVFDSETNEPSFEELYVDGVQTDEFFKLGFTLKLFEDQ